MNRQRLDRDLLDWDLLKHDRLASQRMSVDLAPVEFPIAIALPALQMQGRDSQQPARLRRAARLSPARLAQEAVELRSWFQHWPARLLIPA